MGHILYIVDQNVGEECDLNVRHEHPEGLSPDSRAERLEELYRACLMALGQEGRK